MFSNKYVWAIVAIFAVLVYLHEYTPFRPIVPFLFVAFFLYLNNYLGIVLALGLGIEHYRHYDFQKGTKEGFNMAYDKDSSQEKMGEIYGDGSHGKIYVDSKKHVRNPKRVYTNFDVKIWDPKVIKHFLKFQATENTDIVFDMDMIQVQASQKEAEELLDTGLWPWSERTQEIYTEAISRSNMVKRGPLKSMRKDRTIYNENAILQILGFNEKEGKFLLYGGYTNNPDAPDPYNGRGTYGVKSGLVGIDTEKDLIKCNGNKLQRTHKVGYNCINNLQVNNTTDVDYKDLPNLIGGFQFIKEPCNPCEALGPPSHSTCPFSLEHNKKVSPAWEKMWGLPSSPIQKLPERYPYWMN